jgi:hypothetical protein
MEKTYLSIVITYYNSTRSDMKPEVHYFRDDGVHPAISTFNKLSVDEANLLMWELVKLGAKNTFRSNIFNNAISERRITFWGVL